MRGLHVLIYLIFSVKALSAKLALRMPFEAALRHWASDVPLGIMPVKLRLRIQFLLRYEHLTVLHTNVTEMQVLRGQDVLLQLLQVRECLLHASLIRYDRVRKAAHPPHVMKMILVVKVSIYTFKALEALFACILMTKSSEVFEGNTSCEGAHSARHKDGWRVLLTHNAAAVLQYEAHPHHALGARLLVTARPESHPLQGLRANKAAIFHCVG
mmetsp:Transcript_11212/g.20229  ORF Transcript_11212/g.20229 Transcript_11212/m.20229 type:complete len:213 (-) Transcript_11212:79-717(-)